MEAAEDDAGEGESVKIAAVKGTVRALADSISVEAAERASKQVREAIAQQQRQLEELQRFSDENKSLSELVLELPDSVSHRIMVPFGKVAFFPGRLIHTNEFLVLLGENHYAERSAKQTVEILDRRSEFLDQKIAGTKAQIADLEAESSFVANTAEEAQAGLVEIREDYLGSEHVQLNEPSTSRITAAAASRESNSVTQRRNGSNFEASTSGSGDASVNEDREHDLLMARLSELELAEAAAGEDNDGIDEEVEEDGDSGSFGQFRSNTRQNDFEVEESESSEELEEEDSQLGNSDDEDDYVDGAQGDSEEDVDSEDDEEDDKRAVLHEQKEEQQEQVPLGGRPLSRFAREASARKRALDSQRPQEKVTFQHGGLTDKKPQLVANKGIYSRALQKPEATQGFDDLQTGLQELRREGAYQRERHADEIERGGGSSLSDHSRVPSLAQRAASQLKAFTGVVREHSSEASATANKHQVEPEQTRPVSKFKMSLGKR